MDSLSRAALTGAAGGGADPSWDIANLAMRKTPINMIVLRDLGFAFNATGPEDIAFKPDGTKFYIVDRNKDDVIEYDLSTAWDISTFSYVQNFDISGKETNPFGLDFSSDGTKFYVLGISGTGGAPSDAIHQYNLSTAWDISTASYSASFGINAQGSNPRAIHLKPDGTKIYVVEKDDDAVDEYDMSTAYDISTASFNQTKSVSEDGDPNGLFFKPDGLKMYVFGDSGREVNEYTLTTAWDISTASYTQRLGDLEYSLEGLYFKSDGTRFYLVNNDWDGAIQYDLTTAWDISTGSFNYPTGGVVSVRSEESSPKGVFFKPDGLKMYITGSSGDEINEYNLSTAWDISTASAYQVFSVSSKESNPFGLQFSSDGTKFYITGTSSDAIHQYTLTTGWDISTASFTHTFSVTPQSEFGPRGLYLKPDGTKIYISGDSDQVHEYNMTTAYDLSTASFNQSFDVSSEMDDLKGIFFKDDGTEMYLSNDYPLDEIYQWSLSTAWDISTATLYDKTPVNPYIRVAVGFFIKPDGLELYATSSQTGISQVVNLTFGF